MATDFAPSFSTSHLPVYCYNGRFWDVPNGWMFQKIPTRRIGWVFWLKGRQGNEITINGVSKLAPIRPWLLLAYLLISEIFSLQHGGLFLK